MFSSELLAEILSGIKDVEQFQLLRQIPGSDNDSPYVIEGKVQLGGRHAVLQIELDETFPTQLPRFCLVPWDAFDIIPHVDTSGTLCAVAPEGLVLDRHSPNSVIRFLLRRAIDTLLRGITGANKGDFADEFASYWAPVVATNGDLHAYSTLGELDDLAEIMVAIDSESKPPILWIGRSEQEIDAFFTGQQFAGRKVRQSGLYVPLQADTCIIPPHPGKPFWTAEEAWKILSAGLSELHRTRLLRLLRKRGQRVQDYIIIGLPRTSGGTTLLGLRYQSGGAAHLLWKGRAGDKLSPIYVERRDYSHLVQRGGGSPVLRSKRILLVGGGAVGGHLAFELARAGITDITIVDNDILKMENIFRHVLGSQYLGTNKAQALKQAIEAQFPYVHVTAITKKVEKALETGLLELAKYDLMISALGNPTVELYLNERVQRQSGKPMALFTWLDPLGIGGHALLSHNGKALGCFECLYSTTEIPGIVANRAAFSAPGQSFALALSGCDTLHTPYGSVDAVRTANLALRLAIDAITEGESGNPLLSWRGNTATFEEAGFLLSLRYYLSDEMLFKHRYDYKTDACPCCSRSRAITQPINQTEQQVA